MSDRLTVTLNQRNTLAAVWAIARPSRGVSAWDLGRRLGISESAAGSRLKTLRDKGLVEYGPGRRNVHDAAAYHHVTRLGRDVLLSPADYVIGAATRS